MLVSILNVGLFCKAVWGSQSTTCDDTDSKLHVTDQYGRECNYYDARPKDCGRFNDNDFDSHVLCCSCGGGQSTSTSELTHFLLVIE